MSNEEKGIKEQLKEINEKLGSEKNGKKEKKFKLPARARVGKSKLKKGYITIEIIGENREIDFKKEPIIDGTIKLRDTFHAIKELDIFTYKGKPFVHLPKTKLNPWYPLSDYLNSQRTCEGEILSSNEVHGQKLVMSRMKSDAIKSVKKMGIWIWVILAVVAGIVIYALVKG